MAKYAMRGRDKYNKHREERTYINFKEQTLQHTPQAFTPDMKLGAHTHRVSKGDSQEKIMSIKELKA